MNQIITSLFNFFLEIGRSGKGYKNNRNKNKAFRLIVTGLVVILVYFAADNFFNAYKFKAEIIRLKAEVKMLENVKHTNYELKIRNEILSATLAHYIGKPMVDKINREQNSGLKDNLTVEEIKDKINQTIPQPPPLPGK